MRSWLGYAAGITFAIFGGLLFFSAPASAGTIEYPSCYGSYCPEEPEEPECPYPDKYGNCPPPEEPECPYPDKYGNCPPEEPPENGLGNPGNFKAVGRSGERPPNGQGNPDFITGGSTQPGNNQNGRAGRSGN